MAALLLAEFLGLSSQRTLSVVAELYCEVASIKPETILPGTQTHNRLKAYGEMRYEMESKTAAGCESSHSCGCSV